MDNLAHALVGLALARAGFQRRVPLATTLGIVAANAPDLDLLAGPGGLRYLEYHRGFTHSFAALPLWTLLFVALVAGWERWRGRRPTLRALALAALLAFLAVASHLVLDYATSYGIRLLAPFDERWFAADWVPIVDPWVWLGLGAILAVPLLFGLVSGEIGGRGFAARRRPHRVSGIVALVCLAGWFGFRAHQHVAALDLLANSGPALQQATPPQVAALPGFLNPFAWKGIVSSSERYDVAEVSTRDGRVHFTQTYWKPTPSPAIAAAEATLPARIFLWFARFPLADQQTTDHGARVVFIDLRYSDSPARPSMGVTVLLDAQNRVESAIFRWGR